MPTIGAFMQLLPRGFRGREYRATDATVFAAVEGRGAMMIWRQVTLGSRLGSSLLLFSNDSCTSASVMFACPWYQEAVVILRKNPQISVGVHLVLNSEWKYYRWGPVLGREAVPVVQRRCRGFATHGFMLPSQRP